MLDACDEMLNPFGLRQVMSRNVILLINHRSTSLMFCCVPSRVLPMTRCHPESRRLLEEIVQEPAQSSCRSLLDCVRLDWIRYWNTDAQSSVLLSRLQDSGQCDFIF